MAIRFEEYQIDILITAFEESDRLTRQKKIELVSATGLDVEQITSWFNRRRAQKRDKQSRVDLKRCKAELEQALHESKEREAKLNQELEQSKRREVELGDEIELLKQQLRIVGGDLGIDPILSPERFIPTCMSSTCERNRIQGIYYDTRVVGLGNHQE
ncbi:hypothetical protein BUALT_Bualt02G0133200 [Buddleja alternifolia]|uniref:Homeobox domain-containing protein n=1 Tax=Buddleja alternifolia TaxID=168488 RepID=A0AAV6XZY7_9LAMI|nr:hypothetical protein BUALT_Bualt02G0133200 [Buddleja alternifolia]